MQPVYGSAGGSFNGGSPADEPPVPSTAVTDASAVARSASADSPDASQGSC